MGVTDNVDMIRTLMFVTFLLVLKFYVTNIRWGGLKAKAGLRAPEDTFQSQNPTSEDVAAADRAGRVVSNDLENIPLGLIMLWAAYIGVASEQQQGIEPLEHEKLVKAHMAFSIIFCLARYMHSITYSLAAPVVIRSSCYFIGLASIFAAGVIGLVGAFKDRAN